MIVLIWIGAHSIVGGYFLYFVFLQVWQTVSGFIEHYDDSVDDEERGAKRLTSPSASTSYHSDNQSLKRRKKSQSMDWLSLPYTGSFWWVSVGRWLDVVKQE